MRKRFLFLMFAFFVCLASFAQTKTITGKVMNEEGVPLPGISVVVKGKKIGTSTDNNGAFSISAPSDAKTLVFTGINFIPLEEAINAETVFTITLKLSDKVLTDVVVVGYGTQQKKQVTSAIGKIDPTSIASMVTPSLDRQLGGRTPGLQVTSPSGLVNQAPRIRVRGVNSISGGRGPLIVLDGVPVETGGFSDVANTNLLSDINPADVESIELLKDGSATAIFGSRASNGVILITTKKGKNGKSNVVYSTVFGFSQPYQRFDMLNAQEFVTISNEKFKAASIPDQAFMNSTNTNTDWQDFVYNKSAFSQTHNLSVDGGNDRSNYFFSVNYTNQEGMVITNKVRRYALRSNLEHKISKWLKISNNLTLSRTEDNDQNNGGNALSGAVANSLRALPNVRIFNPSQPQFDGYNITSDGSALGQDANLRAIENNYTNIGFVLTHNKFNSIKHRIVNNLSFEIKPANGITLTSRVGLDYVTGNDFQSLDNRHGDGRGSSGSVFNQNLTNLTWVLQNFANASKTFKGHGINLTAGTEFQNTKFNSFFGQGTVVSDIFFIQQNVISNSFASQFSGGSYNEGPGLVSYFGRLGYDYKNKYFAQFSFRRDGLSRFSKENRFGNFPGVSAGWRISQENFWSSSKTLSFINEFKLRGSWAKVGNASITGGLFPFLSQYNSAPYGAISGISISLVGNDALKWETNEKLDFGADVTLWDNRINLTFDWFSNKNNGLVFGVPVSPSLGVPGNQIFKNIGNMENKGFEVAIGGQILKSKNFSWDLNVNYTSSKNKVIKLPNGDIISAYNIIREGQPLNSLFGYLSAGVNSGNGNPMYYKADGTLIQGNISNTSYFTVVKPDDPTLGTATTLAGTDRIVLGKALPTWFGGISSTLRFKGFSLDMLWRYSGGNSIFNRTAQEALYSQAFQNNGRGILNRWTAVGQKTDVPRLWYGRDNFTNLQQNALSRFIENGNFARLENLQLSYSVDSKLLERLVKGSIRSFRFFVQGQNLWLISKYTGIDPENIDESGQDNNTVPKPRIMSFGFSIGL